EPRPPPRGSGGRRGAAGGDPASAPGVGRRGSFGIAGEVAPGERPEEGVGDEDVDPRLGRGVDAPAEEPGDGRDEVDDRDLDPEGLLARAGGAAPPDADLERSPAGTAAGGQ